MDIKLKGILPRNLRILGFKPGDKIYMAEQVPNSKFRAVRFKVLRNEEELYVTVTSENYVKL